MQPEIYTLPTISFVGGATQEIRFNLKDADGEVFNATGCEASFAVSEYGKKDRLFTLTPSFLSDASGVLSVTLDGMHSPEEYPGTSRYSLKVLEGSSKKYAIQHLLFIFWNIGTIK